MTRTAPLSLALLLLGACNPYPGTSINDDPIEEEDPIEEDDTGDGDTDDDPPCEPSEEVCDGVDNDCDGAIDEDAYDARTFLADQDGDGFGDDGVTVQACEAPYGFVEDGGDCDDARADVNPGAVDTCDGVDNDCDPATGLVTLFSEDGDIDLTDAFSAGSAEAPALIVLDQIGELAVCEGTWFARLDVQADVAIEGVAGSEQTILDAAQSGTVVTLADNSVDASLVGLTLQNGLGDAEQACKAGGLCVSGARLTGEDLVLRDNVSPGEGGGMAMLGGVAELSNVRLSNNIATGSGGALHVRPNGQLTLTDAEIVGNQAVRGGALFQLGGGSRTRMERVLVQHNLSAREGGGIVIDNGDLTVLDSRIVGNEAPVGGGVALIGSADRSLFERTVFEDNLADRGAALRLRRNATLRECQVFGNQAGDDSAAIQVDAGQITIEDTDFQDALGEGNAPVDLRAGAAELILGLDVDEVCTNAGCEE